MNVGTFKRRVQNTFGDNDEIVISLQEIVDWLNEGRRTVVRETHCNRVTATAAANTFPITIVDLYLLDRAAYGGRLLEFTSDESIDRWYTIAQTGTPVGYYLKGNKVYLFPTPLGTDATSVTVDYAFEPVDYTTATADGTVIDVPVPFHDDLVILAKARAHEKNENYRAYELLINEFNLKVGQRKYELEHGKDEPFQIVPDPYDYVDYDGLL